MSKRYGRNQRRRAREQIANLENARVIDQGLMKDMRARLAAAEGVIDRARLVLGNDVALPPRSRGYHPHPLGGDFRIADPAMSAGLYTAQGDAAPMSLEMKVIQMRQLTAAWEVNPVSRAQHFYVQLDNMEAAYAIDERAFSMMGRQELAATLCGPISEALARLLADGLKGRRS